MPLGSNNINTRCLPALLFVVIVATWLWPSPLAQETRRNPEAQKLKNPEAKTEESIASGKKLYQLHCASCHGPNGKGDGSLALAGGTPSDLTDDKWDYGSTEGEIFVVIRDGVSSDMLAYKEKLSEKQIWQIVNFIRSIGPDQAKEEK
jgi:cbb3-type cytochrome c oxidase subunit III